MQLKIFYDHGQTFKTVRFEDSITVEQAIRRFAERTPLYATADPSLYGFYLPDAYPYPSSYTSPPPRELSSSPLSSTPPTPTTGSEDMDAEGWLENDRLLSSYHVKDFLFFKKKTSTYPRKVAGNFTLTRIHLPTSDKTLKYDAKMTVKEAIHYLKSRNPGVDMTNYGLFLLYSPHDTDGFFMDDDRTISSYDLDYQAELHFIPKDNKPAQPNVTVFFTGKQVRRKKQYDCDTLLKQLVQDEHVRYGFYLLPYDDGDGKTLEGDSSVLHSLIGNEQFVVYRPSKVKSEEECLVYGEIFVEVHVVSPANSNINKSFHRNTMWSSKNGISLRVRVDEETTVHELREAVKKLLLAQKTMWATALSEWGVYLPHQTDGESLLDDDTRIISTTMPPIGVQFEIKPIKRPDSFSGGATPGLQVVVYQYNTRTQNRLVLPVDKTSTIGMLKDHIFELMGSRLTPEQAHDYVFSRPCIVDDGEVFDDDNRDLNSFKLDLNEVLEFKPRTFAPPPDKPLLILCVSISPDAAPDTSQHPLPVYSRASDVNLRLPVYSRATKVGEVLTQLETIIRNMNNPSLQQTIQELEDYSIFWKEHNLWLSPTRSICSYSIPPQHTLQLQIRQIGIHIKLWNFSIPQTLGYFKFLPGTLVADIDKKDLFILVGSESHGALPEKFSRNRTVSIYNSASVNSPPKRQPTPVTPDKHYSGVLVDVELDADLYGFYYVPERQIGTMREQIEQPFWLDNAKTLKQNGLHEGSVIELKPFPQPLNVVYPDSSGGRTSVTVQFDMDKPISIHLPIPLEKHDRIIWQKEPHNPSGFLLDPDQSLSAQGIRPYYGASILFTRFTQKKAKYEDNSIDGQINRDLWEELRSDEPEGLIFNSDGLVQAGTVNRLIEHLTNAKIHDLTFMKTIMLTYQAFVTPKVFFAKLVQRYHVPAPPDTTDIGNFVENVQRPIQLRVCNVLKKSIDLSFREYDQGLLQDMDHFVETVLIPSGNVSLAQKIQTSLKKKTKSKSKLKVNLTFANPAPQSRLVITSATSTLGVLEYDELEIARQLTLLEYETFAAIEPTELLNQAWCKPGLMHRSPNILKMISRFNGISSWVIGLLIEPEELKQRVKAFKKIVAIGKHLLELNSLNALMAVIAGWNNSGVLRLKFTIKELPKKTQEEMANLESLMNSEGSYKKYRAYLHTANPPQIPYIGIYLSDLTFIEEGNDDTIRGLVNFEKLRLICTVILELQQYQQQPYNLTKLPDLTELLQKELLAASAIDETTRYQKSLLREPRGATRDEIR